MHMRQSHFVKHVVVALFVGSAMAASTACSDPEPAIPQVAFESTVTAGQNPSVGCPLTGTWFNVGSFGNLAAAAAEGREPREDEKPKPSPNGTTEQQGQVEVSCSVTAAGDGFNVTAFTKLSGPNGGAFTVSGVFKPSGDQANISASFSRAGQSGAYKQNGCTVRYVGPNQGVAAGRVWGEITCPKVEEPGAQRVCEAKAQFRFENCAQ